MSPMIGSFKLDNLIPTGKSSCKSDCSHCSFSTRVYKTNHLSTWNPVNYFLSQFNLIFSRGPISGSLLHLCKNVIHDIIITMTKQDRAISQTVVNIIVAVNVFYMRTFCFLYKEWIRFKSTYWRVYSSRSDGFTYFK